MTKKVEGEPRQRCKESGCDGLLYFDGYGPDGKKCWKCSGQKCREKRDKIREQERKEQENKQFERLIKDKKENPERFLVDYDIPKKHLSKSLDNFKGNSKIVKICKNYSLDVIDSLLLTGCCGSGKTHLAVAILREMVRNDLIGYERLSGAKMKGAAFITAPELLFEIRQSFQDSSDTEEGDIIEKYTKIPFLILDDLGAEKATEWTITTLYLIIDRRNREERHTIFTTNLSLAEIETQLSARIASRLADCKIIQLKMPDYRKLR